jgi:molybdopterin-synthase adenylyltransferase
MPLPIEEIRRLSDSRTFPDEVPYAGLSAGHVRALAAASGCHGRDIELICLEHDIVPERYARNMRSYSPADQAALLRARVGVVGLGGLGGTVTEVLARLGVGRLLLIDGDRFEESNLNRQLLSATDLLGTPKADAARRRVEEVNPSVEVVALPHFLTPENAGQSLQGCNVVVDCLDNLPDRFLIEDACRRNGCPLVSAAVAGASGHVTTIFPEDPGLRLVYGEPQRLPRKGAETSLGTLPYAVVFLATLECAETAKVILKKGGLLRDKLLIADLNEMMVEVVALR